MNNPIAQLKEEHRAVRTALSILQEMTEAMKGGDRRFKADHVEELLDFFRIFVDTCHHGKEEKLLFPALEAVGIGRQGGPIGVMLAEHDQGRAAIRGMSEALGQCRRNEPGAAEKFAGHSRDYRELLDRHIEKENTVLFVLAERYLTDEKQNELAWGFNAIESEEVGTGRHQAFHLMLDRLADRYLGRTRFPNPAGDSRERGCGCGEGLC